MKKTFLFLLLLVGLFSCEPDKKVLLSDLEGYWDIVAAKRDYQETQTLNGAWIKIKGEQMRDNFLSDEEAYPILLQGTRLTHQTDPTRIFRIESVTQDTLVLSTRIGKNDFVFTLKNKYN